MQLDKTGKIFSRRRHWISAPGLRQSYHSQHTLHELRARRLSKTHSNVDLHSTKSDVKVSQNRARVWNSAAVTWHLVTGQLTEQVNRHGMWRGAGGSARAQLRRAAYAYTGTINGWYEEARIHMHYANMQINDITGHYAKQGASISLSSHYIYRN